MRRVRPALVSGGSFAGLVLLLALLPSLLYVGHWGALRTSGGESQHVHALSHGDGAPSEAEHAAHCHEGPATCADQTLPLSSMAFADAVRPDVALGAAWAMPVDSGVAPSSRTLSPTTPPPISA